MKLNLTVCLHKIIFHGMLEPSTSIAPERVAALATDLRAVFAQLKRCLRAHSNAGDLTPSQAAVVLLLERDGPATVSELSRVAGVRSQSMGATVAALEAAGYVAGAPDPGDGRRIILSLTEACRRWLAEGRAARSDWLSRTITERLDAGEQEDLERAVLLLRRLVDT